MAFSVIVKLKLRELSFPALLKIKLPYFSHEQFQSYFVDVWDVSSFSSDGFFSAFSFSPFWIEPYQPAEILYLYFTALFCFANNINKC